MAKRGEDRTLGDGSAAKAAGKPAASAAAPAAATPAGRSRRQVRRRQRERQKRRQRILRLGALALVVAAAAAAALWPRPQAQGVGGERLLLDPAIGPDGAAVTIVEYADFGCPSCRAWHRSGVREQILERYGDDVRFVWKDFPVITPLSPQAAEAGQCALDQGQEAFWAFHDLVYLRGDLRQSSLIAYSEELPQVERVAFESCLRSNRHQTTVEQDLNDARDLRLRGTPSFVVDGRVLPGPPRFEQLAQLIEQALAAND